MSTKTRNPDSNPRYNLALCAAPRVRGESTNRYAGELFAPADTKAVLAAAADITLAKYPDSDEATVERKMVRVYRPDGTGEAQDDAFTKVLTEKGQTQTTEPSR